MNRISPGVVEYRVTKCYIDLHFWNFHTALLIHQLESYCRVFHEIICQKFANEIILKEDGYIFASCMTAWPLLGGGELLLQ